MPTAGISSDSEPADLSTAPGILAHLRSLGNERNRAGMSRYGINVVNACGVTVWELRRLAKLIGRDHALALALWREGCHEAQMLAAFIDEPARVTAGQMERWVRDLDSWDTCDQVCTDLFDRTSLAYVKAEEWAGRRDEFVKRAGFALMAGLAVHDKEASNEAFLPFLRLVVREADDERNFVKKAISWALRNVGKRNLELNSAAQNVAAELSSTASRSARWIGSDARRELASEKVQARLRR
jgi:3-methyladenine DNA glycosylase AlkD